VSTLLHATVHVLHNLLNVLGWDLKKKNEAVNCNKAIKMELSRRQTRYICSKRSANMSLRQLPEIN
jgi:hypothetical protein